MFAFEHENALIPRSSPPNFHTVILFFDLVHSPPQCVYVLRAYFFLPSSYLAPLTIPNEDFFLLFFHGFLYCVCEKRRLCLCALRPLVTPNILGIIFKLETKGAFDFYHICSLKLITYMQRRNIFDFICFNFFFFFFVNSIIEKDTCEIFY